MISTLPPNCRFEGLAAHVSMRCISVRSRPPPVDAHQGTILSLSDLSLVENISLDNDFNGIICLRGMIGNGRKAGRVVGPQCTLTFEA